MVEVVNMKTCFPKFGTLDGDVRIDRKTKWGNPIYLMNGANELARALCIKEYEVYLEQQFIDKKLDIREISHAKRLGCWCKPLACHGDILKQAIDDFNRDEL